MSDARCEGCPANCLGKSPGFGFLCQRWATGDPVLRESVIHRSNLGIGPDPEPRPEPVPRDRWPLGVAMVAWLASPEDRGLGDTVARTIGPIGGDAFKAWHLRVTGQECGCGARQDALNAAYPYAKPEGP